MWYQIDLGKIKQDAQKNNTVSRFIEKRKQLLALPEIAENQTDTISALKQQADRLYNKLLEFYRGRASPNVFLEISEFVNLQNN